MMAWQRTLLLTLLFTGFVQAHVVSLSNGELTVDGRTAEYVLRMPAYEVEQVTNPEQTLLNEIRFGDGRRTDAQCSREGVEVVCRAHYAFDHYLPDKLEVECSLYRVTVPNHIHMLYAKQGENADQRVFDQNQGVVEMRFHPPSFTESLTRDGAAGALRFLTSVSAVLFVVVLALMSRGVPEAVTLGTLYLLAEWLVSPMVPFLPLALSPEFLESVMALTVAYLAGEVLFLPRSRARWGIVPLLGLIHGLPFAPFPALYLAGAGVTQAALLAILTTGAMRAPESWRKPAMVACLIASLAWFARFLIR